MTSEDITTYRQFQQLCHQNAEDALKAAELLLRKGVNHIVFHLAILAMEEIGKIFILWHNLNAEETWEKDKYTIPLDDHIKKLFWAIWGPSFGKEKISRESIEESRGMASQLHNQRLDTLYTDPKDTQPSSAKVSDDFAARMVSFAKARLDLSKTEGSIAESSQPSESFQWFHRTTNVPERRAFIFSELAQDKLIELGDPHLWFAWLKEHFAEEDKALQEITTFELNRKATPPTSEFMPKWKIKFKVISQSHSIRANVLVEYNKRFDFIQLFRGADPHTLHIEATLDKSVPVSDLWQQGWMLVKCFVAALNAGANGFFYWNTAVDLEKYYEEIQDLENKKKVSITMAPKLALGWHKRKMTLALEELCLSQLIFEYFLVPTRRSDIFFIDAYMTGLAMFAKTDIHLRMETQTFYQFYICFKKALMERQQCSADQIKEVGYSELEKLITDKAAFDRVMDLGAVLEKGQPTMPSPITLQEVASMKQYASFYLLTLAVRKNKGDETLRLVGMEKSD
jgi:AbiV family abortive infection protein